MPYERLWFLTLLAAVALSAQGAARAQEANQTADFLILAITPEGDKDYKLVQIGDTKIDLSRLDAAIPTPSGGLLRRLGLGERDYDEAAEIAECRAACKANARCRDFAYARPTENQPLGVCRLKTIVESSFGVMTPVNDAGDPVESEVRGKVPAQTLTTIVFEDRAPKGNASYTGDGPKPTPAVLKFRNPVADAKVFIRAADSAGQRTWATVEAFDAKGKPVERTGAWIPAGGESDIGHAVAIGGESDRIAIVKIDAREPGVLLLEGVEFSRTSITPNHVPEKPVEATPRREETPPPPELPPLIAEYFPLPPRAAATEAPKDITTPPVALGPPAPALAPPKVATAEPPARPAPPAHKRGLPLWLALGAIAVMFAGAGLYWRNHRARTLARLTTRLVSDGLDRRTIAVEGVEGADMSLRFVLRAPANTKAPAHIDLVPKGVPA